MRTSSLVVCLFVFATTALAASDRPAARPDSPALWGGPDTYPAGVTPAAPLSRTREGGRPDAFTPNLMPFSISLGEEMPTSGLIASPPEYSPTRGVLYAYVPGQWTNIVTQMVKELTNDPNCPTCDEVAYVVVRNSSEENTARNAFIAAGANMNKVKFLRFSLNALWIRDYGPHFIWQNGVLALTDSHYYPTRPLDNFVPTQVGMDYQPDPNFPTLKMKTYDQPLYFSGGNFQPGPNRTGFVTTLVNGDNPASAGFDAALIAEIYNRYQGIDTLHVFSALPASVDGTGHIDMWFYLVDEDDVIISQFKPGSNATAISITNNAVPYMQNLGFTVHRTPAWNTGSTHWTYTNAYRVNNRIFTIRYNAYPTENAAALAAFQAAAGPGVLLNPIECTDIIPAAGAIHCIVMQVPRYTNPLPAAHVLTPAGGELLVSGTTHTIEWIASDTNNREIPTVDLLYSYDGGASWQPIATTTNTGSYNWTVPALWSNSALVKVVVHASDGDTAEAVSTDVFQIAPATRTLYTYATGAGVDKFAYGFATNSWGANVNNVRKPVLSQLSTANYARIATSNATGGNTDTNRYISSQPPTGTEATHVFEFTIAAPPADLAAINMLWEGYADDCAQSELYVWDYVQGQWSDGQGTQPSNYGQNRFVDNWAGNRDGFMTGALRSNLDRYIGPGGQMTFLLYVERATSETFLDYVAVSTDALPAGCPGDMDCDGDVDFSDIDYFVAALSGESSFIGFHVAMTGNPPLCSVDNADTNGDLAVSFDDIDGFVALIGTICP